MAAYNVVPRVVNILESVVARFPEKCDFIFAYGSGVFIQDGHKRVKDNMVDLMFAVNDPLKWHTENLQKNRSDYSFLKYGPVRLITKIQENYGAKVYFNTLVSVQDRIIKYGIINTQDLIDDLLNWSTLYASGRLHKPVNFIVIPQNQELIQALSVNLQNALHTALLCLPEKFTEEELFVKIAGFSYTGDFRMIFGEDKNKVRNIVKPNVKTFLHLYKSLLTAMDSVHYVPGTIEHDCSPSARLHHLNNLPKTVRCNLTKTWNQDGCLHDTEDVLFSISRDPDCSEFVVKAVQDIVWRYSWTQSLKGILTGGILKATRYSAKKIYKMFNGWKNKKSATVEYE